MPENAMNRAAVLRSFSLPDVKVLKIEPTDQIKELYWGVAISFEGCGAKVIAREKAKDLAERLSSCDPDLADQIDVCVEQAERYAKGGS